MKENFWSNIENAFQLAGYDTGRGFVTFLAKRYGLTQQAIRDWRQGRSTPKIEYLLQISVDTNVPIDQLIKGISKDSFCVRGIPLLRHSDSLARYSRNNELIDDDVDEWLPDAFYPEKSGEHMRFALRQEGDSMLGNMGLSFPPGSILVFDGSKKIASTGDLVLAKLKEGGFIFRRYISDASRYLMPLNSSYENYTGHFTIAALFVYAVITTPKSWKY